jgi:hypothetical protein
MQMTPEELSDRLWILGKSVGTAKHNRRKPDEGREG